LTTCQFSSTIVGINNKPFRHYDGVSYATPFDVVGDFVYNFQELGQIIITHMSDVLIANKPVEEAMAAAQVEAEALAERIK
jgi:hypothetical protein